MRVVITNTPAALPLDCLWGYQCVSGAVRLGCTNGNCTDHSVANTIRECGFAGSERCGAQRIDCLALSLAARRRLVCVCCEDNSRRSARAGKRPSRDRPGGAARQERNTAHHHGINLVAWRRALALLSLHVGGIFTSGLSLAHRGAKCALSGGFGVDAPVLACPGRWVLAPQLQTGN
jgi:hypothetical protein